LTLSAWPANAHAGKVYCRDMELPVVKNFLTVLQKLLPARNYRQLTLTGGPLVAIFGLDLID